MGWNKSVMVLKVVIIYLIWIVTMVEWVWIVTGGGEAADNGVVDNWKNGFMYKAI